MPCHSECKVQEGKQTCTGPVGLVRCTAATYRQYCLLFPSAIFCLVNFLPFYFCFSVYCLKREPTSVKLVPGYRTAHTACPRVLRAWWEGRRSSLNTPTSRATVSPATLTAHKGQEIWFEGLYFQTGAIFSLPSIQFFLLIISGARVQGLETVLRHLGTILGTLSLLICVHFTF